MQPPSLAEPPDPVVRQAVEVLGGPPGRHARLGGTRWTPVRWLLVLTLLTSLVGFWQKSPCRFHPWSEQYQYTRACYTDVYALWFAERLSEGAVPYRDHPVEYPVVIGGVMAVAAEGARLFPADERPARFYDLTWALLTASALVVVVTTARLAGRRPWDAALFALAPALVLHGTTNWDLVAMALAGLGLLQWSRRRPAAAGLLLGLATATKLYPALFLLPIGLLCLRAGRLRAFWPVLAGVVLVPLLVTLPVYLTSPAFAPVGGTQAEVAGSPLDRLGDEGLSALAPHVTVTTADGAEVVGVNAAYRFVELNSTRPADWDSLWFAVQTVRGVTLDGSVPPGEPPRLLNALVAVTLLVSLGAIAWLALRAPVRPRLPQLLFLVVVAFLVTNKVWSPQFSLWLVPLLALARPRWRSFLLWQATEAVLLIARFLFFTGNDAPGTGIRVEHFLVTVLVRDAVLLGVAALVVRDVLRPELDVVRRSDGPGLTDGAGPGGTGAGAADGAVDDPAGGVLDGAPDRRRPPGPLASASWHTG
ncbi:MAG TPA: glycosyltransferase 87 family protein [Mycobacteriales bacterium]|nr:glycosyltransferase 87 family protein [Mycobacteriales bacterium]